MAEAALSGKITEENAITGFSLGGGKGGHKMRKSMNVHHRAVRWEEENVGQGWVQGATTILARLCLSFTMINFLFFRPLSALQSASSPSSFHSPSRALSLARLEIYFENKQN